MSSGDEEGDAKATEQAEAIVRGEVVTEITPEIQKIIDDATLRRDHVAAVGGVAMQWAYFEATVDGWLHRFAGVSRGIGTCLTAQFLGPRARVDAFIALAKLAGADPKKWNKRLEALANDVVAIGEQRNRFVHDQWQLADATAPVRLEASARRKLRLEAVPVSTQTVTQLTYKIAALSKIFDNMAAEIFRETHPGLGGLARLLTYDE